MIGEVIEDAHGFVQMQTGFGGSRVRLGSDLTADCDGE